MAKNLQKKELLNFLREHAVATLASVNPQGMPEVTAVYFYVEDDLSISFVTKVKTRKLNNIVRNASVSLLVYSEEDLASAEIQGEALILTDAFEFAQTIEKFHTVFKKQKGQYWLPPVSQINAGGYAACRVIPRHIYFRKFALNKTQTPVSEEFTFSNTKSRSYT